MRGYCEEFCPKQEVKLRTNKKLLHFYEWKNGEKDKPGVLVKAFTRSAAGYAVDPKSLRTEKCLQRTIAYLLEDIFIDKRRPFNFAYDFIFDRLRAVRQEIVIQDFDMRQSVKLLEPIVMFLAYSRYRLCEEPIQKFDPKICDQHLQECLKRLLFCYDELTESGKILEHDELKNRSFMEAVYQLFNLGSIDALYRCLHLPDTIKSSNIFHSVYLMALHSHQGNIYRVICNIPKLPNLLSAIASLHIQTLRRKCYAIFSHGYNSKQLAVPMEFICRINQQSRNQLISDCKYYNIKVDEKLNVVHCNKADFNAEIPPLPAKHEDFVDKKLDKIFLPELLLLRHVNDAEK